MIYDWNSTVQQYFDNSYEWASTSYIQSSTAADSTWMLLLQ